MNGKLRCWLLSEEGKAGVGRAVWAEGASRKVERGGGREREGEGGREREIYLLLGQQVYLGVSHLSLAAGP